MKEILKKLNKYIEYYIWIMKGKPSPPPHIIYKRKRLAKIAKKYNCETFIETGTYDGRTLLFLRKAFKFLMSVEIYEPCYIKSYEKTKKSKNIKLFLGDSKDALPFICSLIQNRALFWLDGHYSGDGTGKGNNNCPVLEELKIIRDLPYKEHVILIDDAREFSGNNDYPKIEIIIELLKQINEKYKIEISFDCIIATPNL